MLNPNLNLETIRDEGYEAGIMRLPCVHTYPAHSVYARAFELAFKNGRALRAILDARGLKRVQTFTTKLPSGRYEWRVVIEAEQVAQGSAATQKEARIEIDHAAVTYIENMKNADSPGN